MHLAEESKKKKQKQKEAPVNQRGEASSPETTGRDASQTGIYVEVFFCFFLICFLTAAQVSRHDLRGLGHLANLAQWQLLENPTGQPFKALIMMTMPRRSAPKHICYEVPFKQLRSRRKD